MNASKGTCQGCGKPVKGKAVVLTPPMFEVRLFGAADRFFHPKCYERSTGQKAPEVPQ